MMIAMVTVIDHQTKLVFLNSLGYCAPFHHWFSYEPNDQVFNYLDCCGVSPVKKPSFAQSSNVIIKIIKRFGVVYFKLSPSKKKTYCNIPCKAQLPPTWPVEERLPCQNAQVSTSSRAGGPGAVAKWLVEHTNGKYCKS